MSVKLPTINRSLVYPVWTGASSSEGPQPTEHQREYVQHSLPSIESHRIMDSTHVSDEPLATVTEQRENYLGNKPMRMCHRRRRDLLQCSREPLESLSNYKMEFTQKQLDKTHMCKPVKDNIETTDEAFAGSTMYREDFKRWQIDHGTLVQPTGVRKAAPRHPDPPVQVDKPFEPQRTLRGVTETSGNYLFWDYSKPTSVAPVYRKPKAPFASETSYGSDFKHLPYGPGKMCKPLQSVLTMEGSFDGRSLYRDDFIAKPILPPPTNVYTNTGSLMHSCDHREWWMKAPSVPFIEHAKPAFLRTKN